MDFFVDLFQVHRLLLLLFLLFFPLEQCLKRPLVLLVVYLALSPKSPGRFIFWFRRFSRILLLHLYPLLQKQYCQLFFVRVALGGFYRTEKWFGSGDILLNTRAYLRMFHYRGQYFKKIAVLIFFSFDFFTSVV